MSTTDQIAEIAIKHGARIRQQKVSTGTAPSFSISGVREVPVEADDGSITVLIFDQAENGGSWTCVGSDAYTAEEAIAHFDKVLAPRPGRRVPSWLR